MARIGELDLPDQLAPYVPRWVTQLGVGVLCASGAVLARIALDLALPGAAPFALVFPAAMLATLFARWLAGAVTGALLIAGAWYWLVPVENAVRFETSADALRVAAIAVACLLTIAIAELFRLSVRRAAHERDRQIADRDLFLEEFDHRVKNNFAVVASLLDLQRRRTDNPATVEALTTALSRVESIARAHRHLYRDHNALGEIEMRSYLGELCAALTEALSLRAAIMLSCECDSVTLPRDRAVSVGLVVNELVTNAAKHAFTGREQGRIDVRLCAEGGRLRLTVADNGVGMAGSVREHGREGGLGQRLVEAFARQAGGTLTTQSGANGTAVTLDLAS